LDLSFKGKTVIVTGGTVGIGNEICKAFLRNGAEVVFTSRHYEEGKKVESEFKKISNSCLYVKCDAKNEEEIKNLMNVTVNNYSKINILINNAAAYIYKIMDECTSEDFDYLYRVNLRGYFLTCKHCINFLKKTKGNIVNVSSLVGELGQYWTSLYCATKAGIIGFTKSVALDYAKDGIRANIVLPGAIETNASNIGREGNQLDYNPDHFEIYKNMQPLGRNLCSSEEVAFAVLALASDYASGITGASLVIDRGASLDYSPGALTFYDK